MYLIRLLSNEAKYKTSLAENCIDVLEAEGKKITSCEKLIISKVAKRKQLSGFEKRTCCLYSVKGTEKRFASFLKLASGNKYSIF